MGINNRLPTGWPTQMCYYPIRYQIKCYGTLTESHIEMTESNGHIHSLTLTESQIEMTESNGHIHSLTWLFNFLKTCTPTNLHEFITSISPLHYYKIL